METQAEDNYYEARIDRIFKCTIYKHRTLRTLFDRWSTEWNQTSMDKKYEILTRILEAGEDLETLIEEYKARYLEQNRVDIARSADEAVIILLQYKLVGTSKY